MAGIEETGRLDDDTIRWMEQPRCGMADRTPHDVDIGEWSRSNRGRSRGEPDSYYVPGYMWNKEHLTWKVSRYSGDLSVSSQRYVILEP